MNEEDYVKDEDYSLRVIITKMPWLRPTFPPAEAGSIIGADSFHFLVRDGKGWDRVAPVTIAVNIINDRIVNDNRLLEAVNERVVDYFNNLFLNNTFFGISNCTELGIGSFLHELKAVFKATSDFSAGEKFNN